MNKPCCEDGSKKNLMWVLLSMIAAAWLGYFLWQHRAHVLQYLPLAFFLLCPLMHLFGGHGGHDHSNETKKDS